MWCVVEFSLLGFVENVFICAHQKNILSCWFWSSCRIKIILILHIQWLQMSYLSLHVSGVSWEGLVLIFLLLFHRTHHLAEALSSLRLFVTASLPLLIIGLFELSVSSWFILLSCKHLEVLFSVLLFVITSNELLYLCGTSCDIFLLIYNLFESSFFLQVLLKI